MDIEAFREYCLSLGDVEEKLPFAKMPGGDTVLAFYVNGHTFCYCDIDDFKTVIVKCQAERIPELLENTKGICPPDNHFNAKYWIGLEVQVIETELLKKLVEEWKLKAEKLKIKGSDNMQDYMNENFDAELLRFPFPFLFSLNKVKRLCLRRVDVLIIPVHTKS